MQTENIRISDYNYSLPEERIAKYPLAERDSSKLLLYRNGKVSEDVFYNISQYIPEGTLMVFNNTRVIRARLHFRKKSGALIEIFLLEPAVPAEYQENFATRGKCTWYCLVGNSKKWKEGSLDMALDIEGQDVLLQAERIGTHGTSQVIEFTWSNTNPQSLCETKSSSPTWSEIIEKVGELPIPPYLNRNTETSDLTTYQTVYSKIKGSVAAPTAGLHFTEKVLHTLDLKGIRREEVTLHVGAGTFKPVKSVEIGGHDMHTEHIAVSRHTIETLLAHHGKATAVGTTSVRTLESLYYLGVQVSTQTEPDLHVPQWMPYKYKECGTQLSTAEALTHLLNYMKELQLDVLHASTQIIIAPGYEYKIVERIITNFHQPQSTLLLLVSAFVRGDWHIIYDYALSHGFRFLSYGDSSLLEP